MSLQSWLQNSWLVRHTTSAEEIANLLRISDRDLAACRAKELPADWKLTIAYNAGLQAATAALAASGYRASRDNHHYRVIQSLEFTIGAGKKQVETFDGFRKKRNVSSTILPAQFQTGKLGRCSNLPPRFDPKWRSGS